MSEAKSELEIYEFSNIHCELVECIENLLNFIIIMNMLLHVIEQLNIHKNI